MAITEAQLGIKYRTTEGRHPAYVLVLPQVVSSVLAPDEPYGSAEWLPSMDHPRSV